MGCSPLGTGAYPQPPSPRFYDYRIFGVGQKTDTFRSLNSKSVSLPFYISHLRLDYGQLWQEPAITELDWLFTPNLKLEEYLHVTPLQTSTKYNLRFILLKIRSLGFGSSPSDFRHFRTLPLINCGLIGFPTGTSFIELPLPLKHTPWHVIQNGRQNSEEPCPSMTIRFQDLFTPC